MSTNIFFISPITSFYRLVVFVCAILFVTPIFAQDKYIQVKDAETGSEISDASIIFTALHTYKKSYSSTDHKGTVLNTINTISTIEISYTGFKSQIDTIYPNTSKTYFLEADIFNLDQVIVTATRNKKTLKNTPILTQVITSEQMESRGLQTVGDVLKTDIPSIEFQQHGHGINMGAQGLLATNILILVDGERMAGETRANMDYSRLNIQEIERIEIVKGASSSLYGSQAMGAVINLITKKSKKEFYASVGAQITSNFEKNYPKLTSLSDNYDFKKNLDRLNLTQNYTFGFNKGKWSSRTNYISKSKDAYKLTDRGVLYRDYFELNTTKPEEKYIFYINGLKDYTINQSLDYSINNKLKISAKGSFYKHDDYDFIQDNIHDLFTDFNYTLKTKYKPNDKSDYTLSYNDDVYKKYDYLEKIDDKNITYKHHLVNPKFTGNYQLTEKQNLTSGVEYLHESLLYNQLESEYKTAANAAIFIQDDVNLNENWNTVLGARLDYHTSFGTHFSPKVSLMYKNYPFTFRANYASGYRSPNLKELYTELPLEGLFVIKGNKELNPETNQYVAVSFEYSKPKINTSVSVYRNAFKDRIDFMWFDNQTILKYQNLENSTLLGVDYLFQYQPFKRINIKASYSYVNELVDDVARIAAFSPHTGSIQLGYNLKRKNYRFNTSITGKYLSPKDFTEVDEQMEYQEEIIPAYYTVHYKAYSTWRLSVHQEYKHKINLTLGVKNLFNYTPVMYTFSTATTSGRSYFVGLKLHLEQIFNNQL